MRTKVPSRHRMYSTWVGRQLEAANSRSKGWSGLTTAGVPGREVEKKLNKPDKGARKMSGRWFFGPREEGTEPSTDVRQKGVVFSRCTRISAPASGVATARAAAQIGALLRETREDD